MPDSPAVIPDAASRFFDNHLKCLAMASVPEWQRGGALKRVDVFIKAQQGREIKALSAVELADYFSVIGRANRLSVQSFLHSVAAYGAATWI